MLTVFDSGPYFYPKHSLQTSNSAARAARQEPEPLLFTDEVEPWLCRDAWVGGGAARLCGPQLSQWHHRVRITSLWELMRLPDTAGTQYIVVSAISEPTPPRTELPHSSLMTAADTAAGVTEKFLLLFKS